MIRRLIALAKQFVHCIACFPGHCAITVRTARGTTYGCSCGAVFGETL